MLFKRPASQPSFPTADRMFASSHQLRNGTAFLCVAWTAVSALVVLNTYHRVNEIDTDKRCPNVHSQETAQTSQNYHVKKNIKNKTWIQWLFQLIFPVNPLMVYLHHIRLNDAYLLSLIWYYTCDYFAHIICYFNQGHNPTVILNVHALI